MASSRIPNLSPDPDGVQPAHRITASHPSLRDNSLVPDLRGIIELPPLINFTSATGRIDSRFQRDYAAWTEILRDIFPAETNQGIAYPPIKAADFIARLPTAKPLFRSLSQEIFTLLREINQEGGMVNGLTIRKHQHAHLFWMAARVATAGITPEFLIDSPNGTGKTLELGLIIKTLCRMQIRGTFEGAIGYLAQRSYHLTQQTYGKATIVKHVLHRVPFSVTDAEVREIMTYAMDRSINIPCFSRGSWFSMWSENRSFANPSVAESELRKRFAIKNLERSLGKDASNELVHEISALMSGHAVLIKDADLISSRVVMLPIDKDSTSTDEASRASKLFSGDAAFGIPQEYFDRGLVFTRNISTLADVASPKQREELAMSSPRNFAVGIFVVPSLVYPHCFEANRHALSQLRAVLVDEVVKDPGASLRGRIVEACKSYGKSPGDVLVFGASNFRYRTPMRRPYFSLQTPAITYERAVDEGILPSFGVDVFPSLNEPHYWHGSAEATQQLIDAHFSVSPFLADLKLPQPFQCNTLMVVAPNQVEELTERFTKEYAERGIKSEVFSFKANANVRDYERLQAVMLSLGKVPFMLVASSKQVRDAIDIPTLRNVTVAAGVSTSRETVMGALGRLLHSSEHYGKGSSFRVYFRIQQYSDGRNAFTATPIHQMGKALKKRRDELSFIWGQHVALLRESLNKSDLRRIREHRGKYPEAMVPTGSAGSSLMVVGETSQAPPERRKPPGRDATKTTTSKLAVEPPSPVRYEAIKGVPELRLALENGFREVNSLLSEERNCNVAAQILIRHEGIQKAFKNHDRVLQKAREIFKASRDRSPFALADAMIRNFLQ